MKEKINLPTLIFIEEGFDWQIKGNRHYIPLEWSKKTKVIVLTTHQPFLRSISQLLLKSGGQKFVENINKNLTIFRPPGLIPFNKTVKLLNNLVDFFWGRILLSIFPTAGKMKPIIWLFDPVDYKRISNIAHSLVIYHVVDNYTKSPDTPPSSIKDDKVLSEKADIIFTSSVYLQEIYRKRNENTFYIGNASDTEYLIKQLKKELPVPEDLKSIPQPIAGFIGNMQKYRFDYKLIKYLSERLTDVSFVMVGPYDKNYTGEIKYPGNVFFLGFKHHKLIPDYLKQFAVLLIPYLTNEFTNAMLPLKLFDYFTTGKDIVSTNLETLKPYNNLVYVSHNGKQFENNILKAFKENNKDISRDRIKIGSGSTWLNLIEKSERIIFSLLPHKS